MNLNGIWHPVSTKLSGAEFEASALQSMELTIKDDDFTTEVGSQTEKGKLKINPGTSPMSLDIVSTEGPNVGKVIQAIFRLSDDLLTICYSLQKGVRPVDFTSTSENKYFLVVYKKEGK